MSASDNNNNGGSKSPSYSEVARRGRRDSGSSEVNGISRSSNEDSERAGSNSDVAAINELELMDIDSDYNQNPEYPSLPPRAHSGPPTLFVNFMGSDNQTPNTNIERPISIGNYSLSGSEPQYNQIDKGKLEDRPEHSEKDSSVGNIISSSSMSKKLQSSPFSLMYARNMNAPINYYDPQGKLKSKRYMTNEELLKRIDYMGQLVFPAISEQHKLYTDKLNGKIDEHHVQVNFKPGTYVMHKLLNKTNAFAPSYVGPYQVIRQNDGGAYILRDEEGMLLSRNYVASELKAINQEEIIPKSELFEVEAIIQDNGNPQNREYLVKWKHYSKDHNSWVKADDFTDTEFIIDYWKTVKKDHAGKPVDVKKIINDKRKQVKNHLTNDFATSPVYSEIMKIPDLEGGSRDNNNTLVTPDTSPRSDGRESTGLLMLKLKRSSQESTRITRQMAQQNVHLSSANLTEIGVGKQNR